MQPTAKSLVLDLLSTVPRSSVPVRFLVDAAELFKIDSNSVRVTLTRLTTKGLVESDTRGRYRLGTGAASILGLVSSWRDGERRRARWDGGWIGVATAAAKRSDRRTLNASERALRLLGFQKLECSLSIRPDNLVGEVAGARQRLSELDLPASLPVFRMVGLDTATEARARELWDTQNLRRGYRTTLRNLAQSRRRLEKLTGSAGLESAAAMAESFVIGGEAIRLLALDPLLPDEIVAGADRSAVVAALRAYDELGRACWSHFMKRHGLPHGRAPRDSRAIEAVPSVAAIASGAIA
jgi:phenylacetic acid degradation operon negative regulatory protein